MVERTCSIEGCERPVRVKSRGWCWTHYKRWQRWGDPTSTQRPGYGSGRRTTGPYIVVYAPEHPLADKRGRVREHRMIAWDAGLFDDPTLDVHHINGDKHDNRVENLQPTTNGDHTRHHHPPKSHCPQGHPYSGENLYITPAGDRQCRTCRKAADARSRRRR